MKGGSSAVRVAYYVYVLEDLKWCSGTVGGDGGGREARQVGISRTADSKLACIVKS